MSNQLLPLWILLGMAVQPSVAFGADLAVGERAPAWELSDLEGQTLRLSDLSGQVVLINFFRTTCIPCHWEIPDFVRLQEQYGPQGLVIVGISAQESVETLRSFATARNINYPICPSNDGVLWDYQVFPLGAIPLTVVIDRQGVVADWYRYYQTPDFHEAKIQPLLQAAAMPELSIIEAGGVLELSWPADAPGFILETRSSYNLAVPWQAVTEEIVLEDDRRRVRVSQGERTAFFRLRKP